MAIRRGWREPPLPVAFDSVSALARDSEAMRSRSGVFGSEHDTQSRNLWSYVPPWNCEPHALTLVLASNGSTLRSLDAHQVALVVHGASLVAVRLGEVVMRVIEKAIERAMAGELIYLMAVVGIREPA